MTAICGGGTSSQKPGTGPTIALTAGAVAALLNNIPTPWAVPLAGYLGLLTYDVSTMCATDPPADPGITAADALALLTFLDPIGHTQAVAKFAQLIARFLWYQMCQCDAVETPLPPAAPAAPVGLPTINPPGAGGSYPTNIPCGVSHWEESLANTGTMTEALHPIPSNTTLVTVDGVWQDPLPADMGSGFVFTAEIFSATASLGFAQVYVQTGSRVLSARFAVPPTAIQWRATRSNRTTLNPFRYVADVRFYCGNADPTGPSSGPVPQPCVADPVLEAQIQQLLELVTLIQRQQVPFATVNGASHAGLSGNGQIAVQGLIGVRITPTAYPAAYGQIAGDPDALWLDSWVNWGNADGWTERQFLTAAPFVSYPPLAGQFTLLGYSLKPGLVATITELRREA